MNLSLIFFTWVGLWVTLAAGATGWIEHDAQKQVVTLADARKSLVLRLNYGDRLMLDQVQILGHEVIHPGLGVGSGILVGNRWHATQQNAGHPKVTVQEDGVSITDIICGANPIKFKEKWRFMVLTDAIRWSIDREYLAEGTLEDIQLPGWNFQNMSTWTGALLGNGGVAWCKLFDVPLSTYGVHTAEATLWNRQHNYGLRITPSTPPGQEVALKFTRQTNEVLTLSWQVTREKLATKHGQSRFLHNRQDVWAPVRVGQNKVTIEFELRALDYEQEYDRGHFPSLNGRAIREILNTITRIGVIDDEIMGSNGYYSGYAVLHEPWIAQLGLAINDPHYLANYARTLDFQRRWAVTPDGRVKSRWSYTAGDAMAGTYDEQGFYECQWGWLMDSQPSFVINVVDQFDMSGDRPWIQQHKATCEQVLDFLLRRDSDGDGLVEMMTQSHRQAKGSDWIDIIWASHENAFVNAQMYYALKQWAGIESLLGDDQQARACQKSAAKLKASFNRPISAGGFWNPDKQWYVYWRDADDSVHGDNLTLPVNFMAIAYGLCDEPARARAILNQIETGMQRENLFFWPLCLYPFKEGEGHSLQYPFPNYENGDIFLAWGEVGTRAYAAYQPEIAMRYVRKVLDQYENDGLAFQRYRRGTQRGEGGDILANNGSPIVGLYRNIFGIQPRWNRLCLDPHLTPALNGTQVRYWFRSRWHLIDLSMQDYRITVDRFSLHSQTAFALNYRDQQADFYPGLKEIAVLTLAWSNPELMKIDILTWPEEGLAARRWTEASPAVGSVVEHQIRDLKPGTAYELWRDGSLVESIQANAAGYGVFTHRVRTADPVTFELKSNRDR